MRRYKAEKEIREHYFWAMKQTCSMLRSGWLAQAEQWIEYIDGMYCTLSLLFGSKRPPSVDRLRRLITHRHREQARKLYAYVK